MPNPNPLSGLRRLNQDVIVLGALIVVIALTASIVMRGALAVDLPHWIAIVVGLGLIGAGWFWRDARFNDEVISIFSFMPFA